MQFSKHSEDLTAVLIVKCFHCKLKTTTSYYNPHSSITSCNSVIKLAKKLYIDRVVAMLDVSGTFYSYGQYCYTINSTDVCQLTWYQCWHTSNNTMVSCSPYNNELVANATKNYDDDNDENMDQCR